MIRPRIRRLPSILSVALLGVAVLGISPVSAATPGWDRSNAVATPAKVGPGKNAGYVISIFNDGPGNISALYLVSDTSQEPSFISDSRCNSTGRLFCSFGALNVGQEIVLTVAYTVPTSGNSFKVTFQLNTNGNTGADKGKNSRGDSHLMPVETEIAAGGGNFDGGFTVGQTTFQTNPNITNRNVQSTALEGAPELVPVMIEDGITTLAECDSTADDPSCTGLFGEWSRLNVNNGASVTAPFKVTLVVRGSAVPGGANANTIHVVHVLDDGTVEVINTTCTFSDADPVPTNAECRVVNKVGSNWQIVVWLIKNGYARGGI